MNNIIDVQILTQTHFDSGALSGLGAVVHRVLQPGDHRLTVLRADNPIQAMSLRVLPPAAAAQPSATPQPSELHVNLGQVLGPLGRLAPQPPAANLEMPAQGYALFHAPPDEAGFAVQLHAPGTENQPPSFDSRQLDNTDVYATPLLRPGRYSVTNVATGAKGEIRVSYPVIGDKPYRPPDPFEVQVTDQGFQPASIQLKPAQGLIFRIGNTRARIQIDLVEPDDGPASGTGARPQGPRPMYRWEKPTSPEPK